jgi:hypothetical protein
MQCTKEALFDDLVGAGEHHVGYSPSACAVLRSITSSNLLMTGPVGASKSASPCSELARLGKAAYTSARRGRDFVAVSFVERETDGSEGDADGFETN